jgi:B-cell receptor-associated protein 31
MYLTGFTLFLSLILTRTFYIMLDLIHTQEEYAKLKKAVSSATLGDFQSRHNWHSGNRVPQARRLQTAVSPPRKSRISRRKPLRAIGSSVTSVNPFSPSLFIICQSEPRPIDNLKKQAKQQSEEYDRLATEYNTATGAVNTNKKSN